MEAQDQPLSRADFLNRGWRRLALGLLEGLEASLKPVTRRTFLRPPGAQPEAVFLALCTRCDACTAACPHEAISVQYGYGPPHDGTPVLANLRENPCLLCEDMPCITACPTQALMPITDIRQVHLGTARLDRLECSAYRGSGCRVCYDVCPLPDEAIRLVEGLPMVNETVCTGCGLCERACPEATAAIRVFAD